MIETKGGEKEPFAAAGASATHQQTPLPLLRPSAAAADRYISPDEREPGTENLVQLTQVRINCHANNNKGIMQYYPPDPDCVAAWPGCLNEETTFAHSRSVRYCYRHPTDLSAKSYYGLKLNSECTLSTGSIQASDSPLKSAIIAPRWMNGCLEN